MCLSVLSYSVSAAAGEIVGNIIEVGTGDKSMNNPYQLQGVSDGLPLDMEPLYGDGIVNDTYDPKTGVEVRRWARKVLTGTENWQERPSGTGVHGYILYNFFDGIGADGVCSHLDFVKNGATNVTNVECIASSSSYRDVSVYVQTTIETVSGWKNWLMEQNAAGTPVTVIYQLAEPVTKYHNGTDVQRVSFSTSTIDKTGSNGAVYSLDLSDGGYSPSIHAVGMTSGSMWFNLINESNYYYMVPGYKYTVTVRFRLSSGTITRGVVEHRIGKVADDIADDLSVSPVKDGDAYLCTYEVIPQKQLACWKITFNLLLSGYSSNVDLTIDNVTVKRVDPDSELGDKIDDQTQQQKGFFERLGDRIGGFFEGLLDGIKNLFLPSSEYITEFFDDWNTWFADHFGILYYPFDFFIDICTRLLNLQIPENPSITFPGVEIMGYTLWEDTVYSFDLSALPALSDLHQTYYVVVDVIIALWLINFARKKLNEVMSG